jgi:hypothetical protein
MTFPLLLRLARRWFGRQAAARVVEPLLADWQHEQLAARTIVERVRVQASGWTAAAATLVRLTFEPTETSPLRQRVLRQVLLWSAILSAEAIADARSQAWLQAGVSVLVSTVSWLPAVSMLALWQSRRYAREWQAGLVLTVTSTLTILALTGWVQPRLAVSRDAPQAAVESARTLPLPALLAARPPDDTAQAALRREQMLRLGPAVFALLSGLVAAAHMRSAPRRGRASSIGYVLAGTAACTGFLLFVNAARGAGMDRSVAMMTATAVVMVPATVLFVWVCEAERRRLVRSRPRGAVARPA